MTRSLDVAGTIITVPDPDEIASLSGRFQAVGDALADAQHQVSALASPGAWSQWTGPAADAFGQAIGRLPSRLDAAQESYHVVAAALADYASQLRPVVATLTSLATRAEDAVGNLNATQAVRNQVLMRPADPSLAGWDERVTVARTVVDELQVQVRAQQSEIATLASRCVSRINQARPGAGKKTSLLGRLGHDFMSDVAHPLGRAAAPLAHGVAAAADEVFVHPFTGLWDDAGKLGRQWTWANIGKTFGDAADVLGFIALIPGADVVAVPALLAATAIAVGADLEARHEHEAGATYTAAVLAVADGALSFAGPVFKRAGAADTGLFRDAFDAHDLPGLKALADGTDARVSGTALLKSGVSQLADWSDVKASLAGALERARPAMGEADSIALPDTGQVRGALNAVSSALVGKGNQMLHLGADPELTHSPAAITYQHLGFLTDHTEELLRVVGAQPGLDGRPSSEGPSA